MPALRVHPITNHRSLITDNLSPLTSALYPLAEGIMATSDLLTFLPSDLLTFYLFCVFGSRIFRIFPDIGIYSSLRQAIQFSTASQCNDAVLFYFLDAYFQGIDREDKTQYERSVELLNYRLNIENRQ